MQVSRVVEKFTLDPIGTHAETTVHYKETLLKGGIQRNVKDHQTTTTIGRIILLVGVLIFIVMIYANLSIKVRFLLARHSPKTKPGAEVYI